MHRRIPTHMEHVARLAAAIGLSMPAFSSVLAAEPPLPDLRPDTPPCAMPRAKLPTFGVDARHDLPTRVIADFNGDGWCDYALGVHYPLNSNMNAYELDELMVLGQARGWKPVFNGKKGWELEDHDTWPTFRVDLTDIRLVFPSQGGAPFVLGLYAGGSDEGTRDMGKGCQQYNSVYRWDDGVGTFRKSDEATRDAVLKFFFSAIEKPCNARE